MDSYKDPGFLAILESGLQSLKGHLVSNQELTALLETLNAFRYAACPNMTWFLETLSKFKATVGFILARSEMALRSESSKLDKIYARRYNATRTAGLTSKLGKAPPADALKYEVRGDSEFLEQLDIVSRAEYHRDLLRELRDSLSSRSKEVDQLCNNMRLEIRVDTETRRAE
jgi:hypothetical protein